MKPIYCRKNIKSKLLRALLLIFATLAVLAASFFAAIGLSSEFRQMAHDCRCIFNAHIYAAENKNLSMEYLGSISNPDKYEQQIKSVYYKLGSRAKSDERYADAVECLTLAQDYKDSAALLAECYYPYALSLLERGSNLSAIEYFTKAEDNPDSAKMILRAYYDEARVLMDGKLYERAIELFEQADGYSDSEAQIKACNYELGLKTVKLARNVNSKADFLTAITYFEKAGGHADSVKCIEECRQAIADIEAIEKLIAEREEKYGSRLSFSSWARVGYKEYKITDLYGEKIGDSIRFTVFYEIPEVCYGAIFNQGDKTGTYVQYLDELSGIYRPSMETAKINPLALNVSFSLRNVDNGRGFAGIKINTADLNRLINS